MYVIFKLFHSNLYQDLKYIKGSKEMGCFFYRDRKLQNCRTSLNHVLLSVTQIFYFLKERVVKYSLILYALRRNCSFS